jgi:hypothetical protein
MKLPCLSRLRACGFSRWRTARHFPSAVEDGTERLPSTLRAVTLGRR